MNIDIVGEDSGTRNILIRLLTEYRPDIVIDKSLPVRGSEIKSLAPKYNLLTKPIILLTDLDQEQCAPSLIRNWLNGQPLSKSMLFRVACEESESWLMSDREGFARWLSIDSDLIPISQKIKGKGNSFEIPFPYKPSLFMMKVLASQSSKQNLREELMPRLGSKKGPAYNTALKSFIDNHWDIKSAMVNSDSLARTVKRIQKFRP